MNNYQIFIKQIVEKDYTSNMIRNGILLPTVRKEFQCSRKTLKFKAEGREFAIFLRSLEQFIQTVKGQNNFW